MSADSSRVEIGTRRSSLHHHPTTWLLCGDQRRRRRSWVLDIVKLLQLKRPSSSSESKD